MNGTTSNQTVDSSAEEDYNGSAWINYTQYDDVYEEYRLGTSEWLKVILQEPPYSIMALLSIVATMANIITIVAIVISKSKTTYFRLILNLAVSDLMISLSVIGHLFHLILYPNRTSDGSANAVYASCMFIFLKNMNNVGLIISLLTLMGMAIDQYIAILHPFQYQILMGKRRTYIMLLSFWVISIICGFSDLFTGIAFIEALDTYDINYCALVLRTMYTEEFIVFAVAFICCAVMIYIYVKIYGEVKKQRRRIPVNQEFVRNNKALITTLIILGTFLVCWLPLCIYEIIMIIVTRVWIDYTNENFIMLSKVNLYLLDLVLVNTVVDPLIYSARMREVRTSLGRLFSPCVKLFKRGAQRRGSCLDAQIHFSMATMSITGSRKHSKASLASVNERHSSALEGLLFTTDTAGADKSNKLEDLPELPSESLEQDTV